MRIEQLINDSHQKVIKQHTSTNSQQERKGMEKTDNEPVQEAFVSTVKDKVETVVSKLNEFLEPLWTHLQFVLHEDLDKYYVKSLIWKPMKSSERFRRKKCSTCMRLWLNTWVFYSTKKFEGSEGVCELVVWPQVSMLISLWIK